ncbi:50S ribosomal protein L5 [Candidatus Daviesbacteria bacterium RIFCSPHIGHO2_01_FULL_44_29]|uniref:Large ribosomal subunit protein uL5 n=1 Tax=Candidatus Daviesbacteria bacterium RIFCSPHIGHO2_02_FULL_43_12 TaxID=1797776 RepID=A0A1F5KGH4_9BACT|nr:MAG: 50S ribosomal protein L5 [Candidatus Daviesbacteria bacterium RIFCSPHIGHO2_01_FULL_44_29]OGE39944.1 MAG: 50S ribosomal protein L5 [Candidatus Daviesbacteria bacterium RIFCSPHIGHO2_02_FULL_43_12]OGE40499.1 MAG: 50S ribosomal protein L5 [Candidatus Daviesbacteria bacterium RIFCSPHIGHO2_12_FULL_47_45]OGE70375.1 MAG: 50S ribosomal protein L5 [Candidatus Daviesbacteria bacterium RIFCSPLOWO2_01_FULL_43_15]
MNRLKQKYLEEIRPKLKTDFKVTNEMAVPQVTKVVLNIGIGEAKDNDTVLEKAKVNLASIAGQSPVVTKAKKSISAFKLTKGQPIGLMVTLRGERMYAFLDKFFSAVLPKVRDFRGISDTSFDSRGNFNLGLREQTIFPEIDYRNIDKVRGMQVTIATSAKDKQQGRRLLELLGMPFTKEVHS